MKIPRLIILLFLIILLIASAKGTACSLLNAVTGGFGDNDGNFDISAIQVAGLEVQCTAEYRLYLDGGKNMSGSRRLSNGAGSFINYYLWQDSGANIEWGSSELGGLTYPANPLTSIGNGSTVNHPVYGSALTAGASPPDIYTDMIHVTLTWAPYGPDDKMETDMVISLNLTGSCTLNLDGLNGFGTWPAGSSDLQGIALGVISVDCTLGLNFAVGMDAGQSFQAGFRHMKNGGELISYVLWADSSRTISWGDTGLTAIESGYVETYPSPAQTATATASTMNFFIWGDAMINGHSAGTYIDTVIVTIAW